jgi:hypothetical protein
MFEYPVFWFRSSRNVVRMGPFCMLAAHIIICNIEQISPRVFVFFSTSTSIYKLDENKYKNVKGMQTSSENPVNNSIIISKDDNGKESNLRDNLSDEMPKNSYMIELTSASDSILRPNQSTIETVSDGILFVLRYCICMMCIDKVYCRICIIACNRKCTIPNKETHKQITMSLKNCVRYHC